MSNEQLPEASLQTLVSMLATQAMVAMGILNIPGQEKIEVNLPLAQHFITLVEIIDQKTKNNKTPEEEKMFDQILYELHMGFVRVKEAQK